MGSMERKLKRNALKNAHKRLTVEWNQAKESGQLVNGKELGKKPPLSVFLERMRIYEENMKVEKAKRQAEKLEKEKVADLEWKEE